MVKFKPLYNTTASGKILKWEIKTINNTIITEWGYLNGKKQTTYEVIKKGTNINHINERTPNEQAEFLAHSRWIHHQKRKGYQLSPNTQSSLIRPMLAKRYQDNYQKIIYPCYVQPKLDGIRCIGNKKELISRRGLKFIGFEDLQHDLKELLNKKNDSFYLDGELYFHELSFQEIQSIVSGQKDNKDKQKISFWVFDCININDLQLTFEERLKLLKKILKKNNLSRIKLIPTKLVYNSKEIENYHDQQVKLGYEGIIIRNAKSVYRLNYRSDDLLKYKSFLDTEYKIIGFKEGKGKDKGTVIWKVETSKKQPFFVKPKGTLKERTYYFNNGKKYIGKWLTVKYLKLSKDGIPQHAHGLGIRFIK